MAVQDTLPDPNFKRYFDGSDNASGTAGPGFASVKLTIDQKVLSTRTNSQRLISRAVAGQKWKIDINYNPMTRDEFEPVYAFLLAKQGPLNPFFVSLPQYRAPQNSTWATFAASGTITPQVEGAVTAGSSKIIMQAYDHASIGNSSTIPVWHPSTHAGYIYPNGPRPGDMFHIEDPADTTHTKAYLITAAETKNEVNSLDGDQVRLTITPPLVKNVSSSTNLVPVHITLGNKRGGGGGTLFVPKIKVVMTQPFSSYNLNTDNLYQFNLKLEEYL